MFSCISHFCSGDSADIHISDMLQLTQLTWHGKSLPELAGGCIRQIRCSELGFDYSNHVWCVWSLFEVVSVGIWFLVFLSVWFGINLGLV